MGQLADPGRYVPDTGEETTNGTLKIPYVNGHKPLQNPLNTPFNTDLKIPTYHLAFLFNSLSSGWERVFNWQLSHKEIVPLRPWGQSLWVQVGQNPGLYIKNIHSEGEEGIKVKALSI